MKKTVHVFVLCFVLSALGIMGARATDDWLPNFEDVPMMEKTYTIADDGFVYSQPDGKIVQATVASDVVTRRQLQRFYRDALKELGWKNIKDDSKIQIFQRGGDELKIEIVETTPLSARFILAPK